MPNFNHPDWEYHPVGGYNTYVKVRRGQGVANISVPTEMQTLFAKLYTKRPQWEFVCDAQYSDRFIVECEGVALGEIRWGWNRSCRKPEKEYQYTNTRVVKSMKYNKYRATTNISSAEKGILKSFYAPTTYEQLEQTFTEGASEETKLAHQVARETINAWYSASKECQHWLIKNPSVASDVGADTVKWMKVKEQAAEVDTFMASYRLLFTEIGGYWYTIGEGKKSSQYFRQNNMPDTLMGKIGILKVTDVGTMLHGIGIKLSEKCIMAVVTDEEKARLTLSKPVDTPAPDGEDT